MYVYANEQLCEAARKGDLKKAQEALAAVRVFLDAGA